MIPVMEVESPLWKIWLRQLGLCFSNLLKNKIHVPNHQPVIIILILGNPLINPAGYNNDDYIMFFDELSLFHNVIIIP